jgi:ABC-type glycerol-3-phosphate transport system permease component
MSVSIKRKDSSTVSAAGTVSLVLGLLLVLVFLVAPAVYSLLISCTQYDAAKGLAASAPVGFQNYLTILGDYGYQKAIGWTFLYSAMVGISLFAWSLLAGYLLLAAGKVRWLRHALCTALLLPLLIPQELWAVLFLKLFTAKGGESTALLALWSSLRFIGLPALLVSAALSHNNRSRALPLLAGGIASIVLFVLLGRLDYSYLGMLCPRTMPSMDLYIYRSLTDSFMMSTRSATQIINIVIRCALLAAAAWPLAKLAGQLFPAGCAPDETSRKDRLVSLIVPGVIVVLAAVALGIAALSIGTIGGESSLYTSLLPYIATAVLSAAVNTAICLLLARFASSAGEKGRRTIAILLLLLTALSMSVISIGEYFIFLSFGLLNTFWAVALSGIGSVWGVWPLLLAAKGMGISGGAGWFRRMAKPTLALFAAQVMLLMNNITPSLLYMTQGQNTHPLSIVHQLYQATPMGVSLVGALPNLALMALATMAVPVVLLLVIRTVMSDKESLGILLPGK